MNGNTESVRLEMAPTGVLRAGQNEDDHHAGEEHDDVADERTDRDEDAEHEHHGTEQQLVEGRGARPGAVGEVLAQPAGARSDEARSTLRVIARSRVAHTVTLTDAEPLRSAPARAQPPCSAVSSLIQRA